MTFSFGPWEEDLMKVRQKPKIVKLFSQFYIGELLGCCPQRHLRAIPSSLPFLSVGKIVPLVILIGGHAFLNHNQMIPKKVEKDSCCSEQDEADPRQSLIDAKDCYCRVNPRKDSSSSSRHSFLGQGGSLLVEQQPKHIDAVATRYYMDH